MKYFIVSDVHGFYDELKKGLKEAGFDETNENHTLISLGDAMDRGPKPLEVIKYFNSLPRKILIRGNHEDLFECLCEKYWPMSYDKDNGTDKTVAILGNDNFTNKQEFREVAKRAKVNPEWIKYRDSLIDYFELDKAIFVHGWFPLQEVKIQKENGFGFDIAYRYIKDWRKLPKSDWYQARWINGFEASLAGMFEPNKKIYCGHIFSWYWNIYNSKFYGEDNSIYNTFHGEHVVALDSCTISSHKVNVEIVED